MEREQNGMGIERKRIEWKRIEWKRTEWNGHRQEKK
jgi:hypothetical protein